MDAGFLDRADFESMGMGMEFLKEYKPERPWAWEKNHVANVTRESL